MNWIYIIIILLSSLSAVLAWIAKVKWSKEFAKAKDATIKAKDSQIALLEIEIKDLRELTPMKLREYLLTIKTSLEEYNNNLQDKLQYALEESRKKDAQIIKLRSEGDAYASDFKRLNDEKNQLEKRIDSLFKQLRFAKETTSSGQILLENLLVSAVNEPNIEKTKSAIKGQIGRIEEKLNSALLLFDNIVGQLKQRLCPNIDDKWFSVLNELSVDKYLQERKMNYYDLLAYIKEFSSIESCPYYYSCMSKWFIMKFYDKNKEDFKLKKAFWQGMAKPWETASVHYNDACSYMEEFYFIMSHQRPSFSVIENFIKRYSAMISVLEFILLACEYRYSIRATTGSSTSNHS